MASRLRGWVSRLRHLLGPNVYPEAPDGGWGWLVAVAFFVVEMFTYGTIKSFGIFLQDLMIELGETNSRVSWVIAICVFVMTFTAPLSSVMTNRFGFQPVVMLGGLLISIGTITTSLTTSIEQMYITTGLVAGLGYCLTFLPTVTILSQYFSRRRSLVTAVASTGESFAMFALAPAFSALNKSIGWRQTMKVIGALQGSIVICAVLLRPIIIKPRPAREPEEEEGGGDGTEELKGGGDGTEELKGGGGETEEQKGGGEGTEEPKGTGGEMSSTQKPKLLDFSILREGSFICYSLFGLFATLGFFAPPLYIIDLSVSRGVERDRATYMLSVMAVAEVFGRLSVGWVLSRKQLRTRKILVLLGCVVSLTLVLVAFTWVWEFWGLAMCCGVYGFFMGSISSTHIPMLAEEDVVGIERMASAAGVYVFIQSFAGLAGPPLGGFLVDMTQDYGSAFYSCAAGMGLGAMFLALVRPAKRWLPCTRRGQRSAVHAPGPNGRQDYLQVHVESDPRKDVAEQNGNLLNHSA